MRVIRNSTQGFTLIECLVTLAIVGILLIFAVPMGRDFMVKNIVLTQTETLVSALHYARHQAGLLGTVLTLAPKPEGWSSGMILFIDQNGDHIYHHESDQLLFQWQFDPNTLALNWQGMHSYLLFTPLGLNSALSGTFYVCPINMRTINGKSIIMNRVGRIRVEENKETCNT